MCHAPLKALGIYLGTKELIKLKLHCSKRKKLRRCSLSAGDNHYVENIYIVYNILLYYNYMILYNIPYIIYMEYIDICQLCRKCNNLTTADNYLEVNDTLNKYSFIGMIGAKDYIVDGFKREREMRKWQVNTQNLCKEILQGSRKMR